jgi:hypothetical protein
LFSNELDGQLPNEIGLLDLIRVISLGENKFTDTIPKYLSSMPYLEKLSLEGSGLSGNLPSFNAVPQLRELYLGRNLLGGTIYVTGF